LISVTTAINVVYKTAQIKGGGYSFSPSGSLIISEFIKFVISLLSIRAFDNSSERARFYHHCVIWWNYSFGWLYEFKSVYGEIIPTISSGQTASGKMTDDLRHMIFILFLAMCYAANNNLSFVLYIRSDPATITLLRSLTSFTTALAMLAFLGRPITRVQWFAIMFQCSGLLVFQYDPCRSSTLQQFSTYMMIFSSLLLTTVSSVTNDHILKTSSLTLNAVNALLYAFGIILNMFFFVFDSLNGGPSFFEGYTAQAFLVVFLNSIIGLVITAVYKVGFLFFKIVD
jgi:drug/metabolite transporter (DMT)-like permease